MALLVSLDLDCRHQVLYGEPVSRLEGQYQGNIFVGGLVGTQLQRIVLSRANGLPIRRQSLLTELKQRIREVQQGPDGLLYLLTDEESGALLRIEPVDFVP